MGLAVARPISERSTSSGCKKYQNIKKDRKNYLILIQPKSYKTLVGSFESQNISLKKRSVIHFGRHFDYNSNRFE